MLISLKISSAWCEEGPKISHAYIYVCVDDSSSLKREVKYCFELFLFLGAI